MKLSGQISGTLNFAGQIKATVSMEGNAIVPVFMCSGQSNMVGLAGDDSTLPVAYQGEQPNIKIYWEGNYLTFPQPGTYENMHPVLNTRYKSYTDPAHPQFATSGWSAEQRAMHYLIDNGYFNLIYLIKGTICYGGQPISEWEAPAGAFWLKVKTAIERTVWLMNDIGMNPKFYSFIWLQGESDASDPVKYAVYQTKLEAFLTNLRAINDYTSTMQFVMMKLNRAAPPDPAGDAAINAAFDYVNANYDNTKVITRAVAGGTHLTADELLQAGADWYNHIITLL